MYYIKQLLVLFISLFPVFLSGQIDTVFYQAILQNDLVAVKKAMVNVVDINATDEHGANALMWAVYKSDLEIVKYLVEQGALRPQKGTIPLKNKTYYGNLTGIAAGRGKLAILKYLIEELNIPVDDKEYNAIADTTDGWTALQWGATKHNEEIVNYLIEQNADTIIVATELSRMYSKQKEYPRAIAILKSAQAIFLQKKEALSPSYAALLNLLGKTYFSVSNYEKSESVLKESKNIRERILGKNHPDYATSLNNLALLYNEMGDYKKAEALYKKAKDIREKVLGKEHSDYGNSLHNLASLYAKIGNYAEAEILTKESNIILKNIYGKAHPYYAISLSNLASLYEDIGNYEKSEILFKESKDVFEKVLGKDHPYYASTISNLASLYERMGNYEQSEILFKESKSIREKVLGKEHSSYAYSLHNLASLYFIMGKHKESKALHKESIAITEKIYGKAHPSYATSLNNLALLYKKIGNYKESEVLHKKSKAIKEKIYGKAHPSYASSIGNLAELYKVMGNYEESEKYLFELYHLKTKEVNNAFAFLSVSEKQKYLIRNFNYSLRQIYSYAFNQPSHSFQNLQYDLALFSKGLQLNTSQATKSFILQQKDSTTISNYQNLIATERRLAREYQKPIAKKSIVADLESNRDDLEKKIAKASAFYREEQVASKIDYQAVQKGLKEGEVALEFVHFKYLNPEPTDSILYAVAILRSDSRNAVYIPLFEEQQLGEVLETKSTSTNKTNLINQVYAVRGITPTAKKRNAQQLYDLIWQPLDSLLSGMKTIYYSPSGLLHRLNMNALPIGDKQILADKYNLVQLSSTRLLVLEEEPADKARSAYLVGGVKYDVDTTALLEKMKFDSTTAPLVSRGDYFKSTDRSLRGERWNYLPGTKKESRAIQQLTQKAGYEVSYQEGNTATETAFKKLGTTSKSPTLIHLATHGFFFSDPQDSVRIKSKQPIFKISEHPMLRSGLLLAGANRVWEGGELMNDQEDGILTAMEISQMNLSNTELVVLSACETGLGDIQGSEGVYGLQRAFKQAGVKYLIMSLWQVPDKETSVFMTTFYKNWLENKMSISDAFNKTQKEMRDRFLNPHQWAGFVLIE